MPATPARTRQALVVFGHTKKRDMYLRYVSLRQSRSGRDTDQRSMSLSRLSCYRPEASPIASSSRSAVTAKSTTASTASWKKSSVMFS